MLSIFDDIPDTGKIRLLLVSIYIEEMLHQLSLIPADAWNQGEFRDAFHSAIAINVSLDVFHLRRGKKGQTLHLLASKSSS